MRADIFKLHSLIVNDYRSYIQSFININDSEIREIVKEELNKGKLWPEPLIQFNPAFATYGEVTELVEQGLLNDNLVHVFRDEKSGSPYKLYKHQVDAIRLGTDGKDFVVTSGTGSGKTLTFIGTVLNRLFETKSFSSGIQAVLVYPMNALINSQIEELDKYARVYEKRTGITLPFSYAAYTGQLKEEARVPWRENPPDLLLTNYMMLELIITRHREHTLRDSIYSNLKYLVFDELHTYRGRRGADVGLLIRRIRSRCEYKPVCIGTSATMVAGSGSIQEQKAEVAKVAKLIFGKPFEPDQIIQEKLQRSFSANSRIPENDLLAKAVHSEIDRNADVEILKSHPTAIWLENKISLGESDGELIRNVPRTFSEIASLLSKTSGRKTEFCIQHLMELMDWINKVNERSTDPRYTYLPYKLHQFFAQTGSVYTSLAHNGNRHITLEPGVYKADSEGNKQPIFPNVFSRGSGYEFLCVYKNEEQKKIIPREFDDRDRAVETCIPGYLITSEDVWDRDRDLESLPDAWLNVTRSGEIRVQRKYADRIPKPISFNEWGHYSDSRSLEQKGWFIRYPLLFDPTSGQFFDPQTNESTKLTKLGSEGRSTSTTITAFSILTRLAENGFDLPDQKLLSFTDNRQDAALQAGHFNDFIKVIQLRAAIRKAVDVVSDSKLTYKNLGDQIFEALALEFREYANYTSEIDAPPPPPVQQAYREALKKYLVYLALYDLRRSWRVVLPNLEQCALLRIDYANLDDIAAWEEGWAPVPLFGQMAIRSRCELLLQILEFFRLEYAIYSENYLSDERIRENRKEIEEKLIAPWRFEQEDKIDPYYLRYDTLAPRTRLYTRSLGITSAFGKFIKQQGKQRDIQFRRDSYREFLIALLNTLEAADYLKSRKVRNNENEEVKVYQLKLDKIIWLAGNRETVIPDVVKQRAYKTLQPKPNLYFQQVYLKDFSQLKRLIGGDHTGQLTHDQRIDREEKFRANYRKPDGSLDRERVRHEAISALFCSPTMELGIDIRELRVVHMRNAPPNPANYAQRSGRAGRGGQAALVFSYCSSFSNHDRHYFRKQQDMVSGTVLPPRIDLCNRELLTSHLHAVFLSEAGLSGLDFSLLDLVSDNEDAMPLTKSIHDQLAIDAATFARIRNVFQKVVTDFEEELHGQANAWFSGEWIDRSLRDIAKRLDNAMNRWRSLYRQARATLKRATQEIEGGVYGLGSKEYKQAKRNQDQATRQLDLLKNRIQGRANELSEFYPYRYLASEAFLPGYNFTRLPLRTFIPVGDAGEYISRPRFIALREFGPGNVVYYNGQKYEIKQLIVQDAENQLKDAKISLNAGYFLQGAQKQLTRCPFTHVDLSDNNEVEYLHDLLEMPESKAVPRARISCEEEERISRGFQIETYFTAPDGDMRRVRRATLKSDTDELLHLHFIPAADLVQINRKWRNTEREGYTLGLTSGFWKTGNLEDRPADAEDIRDVKLYTTDTADALYIEPIEPLGLDQSGVTTMQYALKRAIENVFLIEPSELGVVTMGRPDHPNVFLYEAAEGSLGILSQFADNVDVFHKVIEEAIRLLRFDDAEYKDPASYDDLLSYYNQRDHAVIDRFLIQDALEKLHICTLERHTGSDFSDYDAQYQSLRRRIDPNSSTELMFLDYLYQNNLRLPDAAQKSVDGIYVQPDFFYEPDIWIFCDGTPHDKPDVKAEDNRKRDAIRNQRGDQVIVYYYRDDLTSVIEKRPDIFTKVR